MMTRFPIDWSSPGISELIRFLDEITREDRSKEPLYRFVDVGHVDILTSKRHHVIFGRRGSGKSVLLRELENRCRTLNLKTVLIDIEGIETKSYPNLIIRILSEIFEGLLETINSETFRFFRFKKQALSREISKVLSELDKLYVEPDDKKQQISDRVKTQAGQGLEESVEIKNLIGLTAKVSSAKETERIIVAEGMWQKINVLYNGIERYRDLIKVWLETMNSEALYLLIDDFYQVGLDSQPLVADYLKRLFRGVPCYLKISTAPGRSLLFAKDNLAEAGLQIDHDYTAVQLDHQLDYFEGARSFLNQIFQNICREKLNIVDPDSLFEFGGTNGLNILTEASGGNPRDFINLLKEIIRNKRSSKTPINYSDIRDASILYAKNRRSETEKSYVEFDLLNSLLRVIIELCQKENDIAFYISKKELRDYSKLYALIGQLVDIRFIHLLTQTYAPPIIEDGTGLVYVLSMGIYSEYRSDISLVDRKISRRDYPKLELAPLSTQFSDLGQELEFIGKAMEH